MNDKRAKSDSHARVRFRARRLTERDLVTQQAASELWKRAKRNRSRTHSRTHAHAPKGPSNSEVQLTSMDSACCSACVAIGLIVSLHSHAFGAQIRFSVVCDDAHLLAKTQGVSSENQLYCVKPCTLHTSNNQQSRERVSSE